MMVMSLSLRLALDCTVCLEDMSGPKAGDAQSVALFGRVSLAKLAQQGICPKCLCQRERWTKKHLQNILDYLCEREEDQQATAQHGQQETVQNDE